MSDDADVEQAMQALARTQAVLAQLAGFARRRARRPALRDLRALLDQISPVLVHVAGDDITWTMATGDEPLHASLDASELEQCLAAIVTQGREALPLGGQMKLSLAAAIQEGRRDGRGARPEIVIAIEVQGYGLQPVVVPPTVQTQVMRSARSRGRAARSPHHAARAAVAARVRHRNLSASLQLGRRLRLRCCRLQAC